MLTFIIGTVLGFALGWYVLRMLINYKMKAMLDSIAETPLPVKTINLNMVKMDHAVLVYNKDTQQFLAQGNTKEELVDILRKRYPNTNFMINSQNLREMDLQ